MRRPLKPTPIRAQEPFFGAMQPVAVPALILLLGLVAAATFYASVLTAAHIVAADNGLGRAGASRITLWVCALFLAQGLVPVFRFGTRVLPRLTADYAKAHAAHVVMFVVLLIASAMLFL